MSSETPSSNLPPRQSSRRLLGRSAVFVARRLAAPALLLAAAIGSIGLMGVAQRSGWLTATTPNSSGHGSQSPGAIFTCPMHPQIRQPSAGRCPICGMELVPAASAGAMDLEEFAVKIEPAQRRLANIQTSPVESSPVDATMQSVGIISIDESRLATISAYIDGRLERLFADYTGVVIQKGDHLAMIYSPQLYSAQVEYLEARRALQASGGLPALRQGQQNLVTNTRQRLREFGMTDTQLSELESSNEAQSRLTIYAPQGGTVIEKLAVEGNYVKAGDPIYRIAELSTVWLMLKLFPEDAARTRFGQRVEATVQSLPGEMYVGRVAFIDPTVDPKTRTVGVRVELLNEEGRLRPGDYAHARIRFPIGPQGNVFDRDLAGKWISPMHPQIVRDEPGSCPICGMDLVPTSRFGFSDEPVPHPEAIHVPRSAVLLAGGNSIVYVETTPGRFEIRPVTVGPILRDKIIILDGLKPGEQVATAGNFLIDSQMQLAGKPSLIDPARAVASHRAPNQPLTFPSVIITPIADESGEVLETLYDAYFQVQKALAADQVPPAAAAESLHESARRLSSDSNLRGEAARLVNQIAESSQHLHHLDLKSARKEFKPVSRAVVTLATQIRGEMAEKKFTHFFCPMVPGGEGDWLQSDDRLLNPYFGSEMLRCGEKVNEYPPRGAPTSDPVEAPVPSAEPSDQGA